MFEFCGHWKILNVTSQLGGSINFNQWPKLFSCKALWLSPIIVDKNCQNSNYFFNICMLTKNTHVQTCTSITKKPKFVQQDLL